MLLNDCLELAADYIEAGFPVMPVFLSWNEEKGAIDKRPTTEHGYLDASLDLAEAETLFLRASNRARDEVELGVAIVLGPAGYVLLDCDCKKNQPGLDTLQRLEATYGEFARAAWRTPSGGRNVVCRKPPEMRYGMTCPPDWEGIDIRADVGYAVAPGVTCSWGSWTWEVGELADAVGIPHEMAMQLQEVGEHVNHVVRDLDDRDETALDILVKNFGAHDPVTKRGYILVTRPGKNGNVGSATIGARHPGEVFNHSTAWKGLPHGPHPLHKLRKMAGIPGPKFRIKPANEPWPQVETLSDLLDGKEPEYDWAVPYLFERGDRLILTGKEGRGKSTLLRQIGLGAALGLNTLSHDIVNRHHDPLRVLLIDLENSRRQLRREFRKQLAPTDEIQRAVMERRFFVVSHPEGLALNNPKDRDGDRAWVLERILVTRPDMVILGPIYKMIDGDPNDEMPNRDLIRWLDWLRTEFKLVLILEAHTPHGERRPYGWSGWKRWPEFGLHLNDDGALLPFRTGRDERQWPPCLERGKKGSWLWVPGTGEGEDATDKHEDEIRTCQVGVLRTLHEVGRPMSRNEIVIYLGRRRAIVNAAISRLQERGAFIVTEESTGGRPLERFALDPDGPYHGE